MRTRRAIAAIGTLVVGVVALSAWSVPFDPAIDGWYFSNWEELAPNCVGSCEFSWDLYRQAYLGINPTHDCVEAPLDCAYYEIFKRCAEGGNCGGMSLLALALYKYGGYMGFCSPANFYTGAEGPDRDDLHQAVNNLQARQFSASGIENFLDLVGAGDLNNAERAFYEVKENLGKGDYPVLSLANSFYGADAHTVIPYAVEENPAGYPPGTKIMYIWDSNHPYDEDPDHYADWNTAHHLVIHSTYDWSYTSGGTHYSGGGWDSAWCFCVPMSKILHKARQPMALDMVFDALLSAFISGPGAVLTQISDDDSHRVFAQPRTTDQLEVWEEDPAARLEWVFRWPWVRNTTPDSPELFFVYQPDGGEESGLSFTVDGASYRLLLVCAGDLFELTGTSAGPARDVIRLSGTDSSPYLEITTSSAQRTITLRQLRITRGSATWRGFLLRDLVIRADTTITIATVGDLAALNITSSATKLVFTLSIESKSEDGFLRREFSGLTAPPGRWLQVGPSDWGRLDVATLERVVH